MISIRDSATSLVLFLISLKVMDAVAGLSSVLSMKKRIFLVAKILYKS